jgi:feruloyl-CoA synthase
MTYRAHSITATPQNDGSLIVTSNLTLGRVVRTTGDWVDTWATKRPDHVFIAERSGAGWNTVTYGALAQQVQALGAALLGMGLQKGDRILCLSGASVTHGVLTLAAQYVGLVTVPVAEQYSLIPQARGKLHYAFDKVAPKVIFAENDTQYCDALADPKFAQVPKLVSKRSDAGHILVSDLLRGDSTIDIAQAHAQVGPDDMAKILFTSGSTSNPKGVPQTHRMMCVNQEQYMTCLPFLTERPHIILDWLPWNHVFAGSSDFNMVLSTGGSLYLDDGKPVKGLFDRTLENIMLMPGTLALNVPVAYAMLVDACRKDDALKRKFFGDLDMIFYAGASLPRDVWDALESMSREVRGKLPLMTSSWGMTETAPMALIHHATGAQTGMIGVPAPEVSMKLIQNDGDRYELRVKGPNVITGYYDEDEKNKTAFDADGYLITEDAVRFVDPQDLSKGVVFDGRISEDFKLLTGIWVQAGMLRMAVLKELGDLAQDIVITGADRADLGILVFPPAHRVTDHAKDGTVTDASYLDLLTEKLTAMAQTTKGSSQRIVRAAIMADPPSIKDGEITAKGNLNNKLVLKLRGDIVERLYAPKPDTGIICITS